MKELPTAVDKQMAGRTHDEGSTPQTNRIPLFRRDLKPTNFVLSADDLSEFFELLQEINSRAKTIELSKLNLEQFENMEDATERVRQFVTLEYIYRAHNGDSVQGLGAPDTQERMFPDDLLSIYVSNASFAERSINVRPLNTVEVFLDFKRPSLKIDLNSLPSNPTENDSIINVVGRDEDWVISSADKIATFFKKKKVHRPAIHGSGTYDYLIWLFFLPAWLWLFSKNGAPLENWLEKKSIFFNVMAGISALFASLLVARFTFQYIRWAFPPTEFFKKSQIGAFAHRAVIAVILSTLLLSAGYEFVRWLFLNRLA
ncbi:MAG: hypothetical protein R3C08_10070 [Hyphomonas sp.]